VQSSSQFITTNKPTSSFLQAGCPSCRPTNSVKALKGKITHSMDLLTPSSPGGLPTLSLTTNSSWLPWGKVAMPLISSLMPVPFWRSLMKIKNRTGPRRDCCGTQIVTNLCVQLLISRPYTVLYFGIVLSFCLSFLLSTVQNGNSYILQMMMTLV